MVTVGNSGAVWTGAGGLTIPRSHTSFQNSISALYSYRAPVTLQPALGPLCACCSTNQCFVLFAGSEQSMCNDADIIYSSQTELAGCDEWQIIIKMECECDVIEGRSTRLSFFLFLYYAYSIILNDRLSIFFIFLCCTFHCVNSKMLNAFSILTGLIKYILG